MHLFMKRYIYTLQYKIQMSESSYNYYASTNFSALIYSRLGLHENFVVYRV